MRIQPAIGVYDELLTLKKRKLKWFGHVAMVYQDGQKHRYGSTRISKIVKIHTIRVDLYFTGPLGFTGRPVKYGSRSSGFADTILWGNLKGKRGKGSQMKRLEDNIKD